MASYMQLQFSTCLVSIGQWYVPKDILHPTPISSSERQVKVGDLLVQASP